MKWNRSTILKIAGWSLIAVANVVLCIFNYIEPDTGLLLRVWRNRQVAQFTTGWHSIDDLVLQAPGNTDVAMIFFHFDENDPTCRQMAQEAAHRGAYTLYPRKLVSAWDGTILGDGKEILANQFNPDPKWLQDRGIRTALVCLRENGAFSVMKVDVPLPAATTAPSGGP